MFPPIEIKFNARTWRDIAATHEDWANRVLLKPLRERLHGQPWEAEAKRFFQGAIEYILAEPSHPITDEIIAAGRSLKAKGCVDPLIVYLAALCEGPDSGQQDLIEALAVSERTKDSTALSGLIAREIAGRRGRTADKSMAIKAVKLTARGMEDGTYLPSEDELFIHHLLTGTAGKWINEPEEILPLTNSAPLGEWAQLVLRGTLEAWLASSDYANGYDGKMDPARAESYRRRISIVRQSFTRAWKLQPRRPQAAAAMIKHARGETGEGEDPRIWFDRAIAAQFDYFPAYRSMLGTLMPRAGGSLAAMQDFADACLATGRMDTTVPQVYMMATSWIAELSGNWRNVFQRPDVAAAMIKLSRARLEEPSLAKYRRSNEEMLVVNAYLCGDLPLAAAAYRTVGGKLGKDAREKLTRFRVTTFESDLRTFQSGDTNHLAIARQHRREGRYDAARKVLEQGLADTGVDRRAIEHQIAFIDFLQPFSTGAWVKCPDDRRHQVWSGAPWFADPLPADYPLHVFPRTYHAFAIGENAELRGSFRLVESTKPVLHVFFAGRQYTEGPPYPICGEWFGLDITAVSGSKHAARMTGIAVDAKPVALKNQNTFLIRLRDGLIDVMVNDEVIFTGLPVPFLPSQRKQQVTFGFDSPNEAAAAPSHLEVRKIPRTSEGPNPGV